MILDGYMLYIVIFAGFLAYFLVIPITITQRRVMLMLVILTFLQVIYLYLIIDQFVLGVLLLYNFCFITALLLAFFIKKNRSKRRALGVLHLV